MCKNYALSLRRFYTLKVLLSMRKVIVFKVENVLVNLKEPLTEFDEDIFKAVVQKITFPSDTEICFELAGGLKITEKIPEQVRCRRT